MSSNLFVRLSPTLKKHNFSDSKINSFARFFSYYHKGNWIYPGTLKRELNITIEDSYRILEELKNQGIVESYYELRCGHCQHVFGIVQCFNELPDSFECESCGSIMNTLENTIKIYKVL